MTPAPVQKSPALDWRIDIWKLLFLLPLFCLLLVGALMLPNPMTISPQFTSATIETEQNQPLEEIAPIEKLTTNSETQAVDSILVAPLGQRAQADVNLPIENVVEPAALATAQIPPAIPLALSNITPNALLPEGSVALLQGTAAPNSTIEISIESHPLDTAQPPTDIALNGPQLLSFTQANEIGYWEYSFKEPLQPGRHTIVLRQLPQEAGVGIRSTEVPVVVTIMITVGITVDGVLQTGVQPTAIEPQITSPAPNANLLNIPLTFRGTAPSGLQVSLFLNDQPMGNALTNAQQIWQIPVPILPIGNYQAHVEVMDVDGNLLSQSPTIQFVIQEDYPRGG